MKKRALEMIKIGSIYAGAVLGAGFASGQELMLFFVRYGVRGLWGAAAAGLLFAVFGIMILSRSHELHANGYQQYFSAIFGKRISAILCLVVEVFLAISFVVMISGSGALFLERFSVSPVWGILITLLLCYWVFRNDLTGLSVINFILTPLMVVGITVTSVYYLITQDTSVWASLGTMGGYFMVSAVTYVSYNMLTASAVLVPVGKIAADRRTAAAGGAIGGLALLLVVLLSCFALYFAQKKIVGAELPLLMLSQELGSAMYFLYSLVLYMAMITTAVATGFSIVERFAQRGVRKRTATFWVCLFTLPLSFIQFSSLVKTCYSFFGYLGLLLLCGITYDYIKSKIGAKRRKT